MTTKDGAPPRPPHEDLADFMAGGGSIDDLLYRASSTQSEVTPETEAERGKLAATGLDLLKRTLSRVAAAQDKKEQRDALAFLCEDGPMGTLGWASRLHDGEVSALLLKIGALRGLSKPLEDLKRTLRRRCAELSKALKEQRAAGAGAASDRVLTEAIDLSLTLERALPGAKLPRGLTVRGDWTVDERGIYAVRVTDRGEEVERCVCPAPILPAAVLSDPESGAHHVLLRWCVGRTWSGRVLPRQHVTVGRALAEASAVGVPVSSRDAQEVAAFLNEQLIKNDEMLPVATVTTTLGWKSDGFLWGTKLLGERTTHTASLDEAASAGTWKRGALHLAPPDGVAKLLAGYREMGSWAGWVATIEEVKHLPSLYLALLGSLAVPLLKLIPEASPCALDYASSTSQGKTTALRLAASAWGLPTDRGEGLVRSWESTDTWTERAAVFTTDLPMILDDTSRVADKAKLARAVYRIVGGQSKGRGSIFGVQPLSSWRTLLISSGEQPLTNYASDGGAFARCLTLKGSPFGATDAASAALSTALSAKLCRNYGHAGPRLVRWLQREGSEAMVLEQYAAFIQKWTALAAGNPVASRACGYLALLSVAYWVALRVGVPRCTVNPLGPAWEALKGSVKQADRPRLALQDIASWCASQQWRFWGRHQKDNSGEPRPLQRDFVGWWSPQEDWQWIGVRVDSLRFLVKELGYSYEECMQAWGERGWLGRQSGKSSRNVKIQGVTVRVVCLLREGIESAGREDDEARAAAESLDVGVTVK